MNRCTWSGMISKARMRQSSSLSFLLQEPPQVALYGSHQHRFAPFWNPDKVIIDHKHATVCVSILLLHRQTYATYLFVRQSFKFSLFKSKRLKHLHRTIDVSAQIWNHCVALHRRYYKIFGKGLSEAKLKAHIAKLRNGRFSHSESGR